MPQETVFMRTLGGVEGTPGVGSVKYRYRATRMRPTPKLTIEKNIGVGSKFAEGSYSGREWTESTLEGPTQGTPSIPDILYHLASALRTPVFTTPSGATNTRRATYQMTRYEDPYITFVIERGKASNAKRFNLAHIPEFTLSGTENSITMSGRVVGRAMARGLSLSTTTGLSNTIQLIQFTTSGPALPPNSGTFSLVIPGSWPIGTGQTVSFAYNATAAQLQSAFQTVLGVGNVIASLGPISTGVQLEFVGSLAGIALATIQTGSVVGGYSAIANITQAGGAGGTALTELPLIPMPPKSVCVHTGPNNTTLTKAPNYSWEFHIGNRYKTQMLVDCDQPSIYGIYEDTPDIYVKVNIEDEAMANDWYTRLKAQEDRHMQLRITSPILCEAGFPYSFLVDMPFRFGTLDQGENQGVETGEFYLFPVWNDTLGYALKVTIDTLIGAL